MYYFSQPSLLPKSDKITPWAHVSFSNPLEWGDEWTKIPKDIWQWPRESVKKQDKIYDKYAVLEKKNILQKNNGQNSFQTPLWQSSSSCYNPVTLKHCELLGHSSTSVLKHFPNLTISPLTTGAGKTLDGISDLCADVRQKLEDAITSCPPTNAS